MKKQLEEHIRKYKLDLQQWQQNLGSNMQFDFPPLDVPPSTSITRGHLPLKELAILDDVEDEVLNLTTQNFYQVNYKIM